MRSGYKLATTAQRSNLAEVKAVFFSADRVANFTVFNIRGNN
ncbi:type II toxin-antitoxin system HigB family toxin [Tychonema sp. LEGE 07203]|nr:type II toxin-antitoxin system HigB family toxin [Tychonema sp. LEGE 07203]